MRTISLVFLTMFLFASCGGERQKAQKEIRALERQAEGKDDAMTAGALIRSYLLYNANFPEDSELNSRYLYRAAALQLRLDQSDVAANTLIEALRQYPKSDNTLNNASLLAAIYQERLYDPTSATTIYQLLEQRFPEDNGPKERLQAMTPPPPPLDARLEEMRKTIFIDSTGAVNFRSASYFVHSCELFGMLLPDHSETAEWLHKGAEIARATKKNVQALNLYQWIYEKYPDYIKAPQALFLKAFILDEEMGRQEEAREAYELFLQRYPENEFADDAQFLLDNLGKDEAEIIDQFQQSPQGE